MKRYWLFAGNYYYPSGGMGDFQESFEDSDLLHKYFNENREDKFWDWGQILDTKTNEWTSV